LLSNDEVQGDLGHTVPLMPPAQLRPYVKRQNNDATDAERHRKNTALSISETDIHWLKLASEFGS
jgi:hypothetical protein